MRPRREPADRAHHFDGEIHHELPLSRGKNKDLSSAGPYRRPGARRTAAERGPLTGTRGLSAMPETSRWNSSRLIPAVRKMLPSVPRLIGWLPWTGTGKA